MDCNCKKNDKKACNNTFTKAVVENINPERFVDFRKVIVPASMGDDVANPPVPGKYCNVLLYYEANDQVYLYSSDGIPTKITVDIEALKKQINKVADDLATETEERKDEDQKIWDEIEVIEAASDVVDVVGTYAELEAYDTSKLHDKDLIKVLQDETHDDAISYYRYSTSTHAFSYVGSEGPYYTESQVDVLLGGKQDKLIAGSNITIASDGKTISATDTTYSDFTGATSLADGAAGLVPAPLIADKDKYLKGDGTWGNVAQNTVLLYVRGDLEEPQDNDSYEVYYDQAMTQLVSAAEFSTIMYGDKACILKDYSDQTYLATYSSFEDNFVYISYLKRVEFYSSSTAGYTIDIVKSVPLQPSGGDRVSVSSSNVISVSNMQGATSSANGLKGLVPAPLIADKDKFLKGDGTWDSAAAEPTKFYTVRPGYSGAGIYFYKDSARTTYATYQDVVDALQSGNGVDVVILGDGVTYDQHNIACSYFYDDIGYAPDYYLSITFPDTNDYYNCSFSNDFSNLNNAARFYWYERRYTLPTAASNILGGVKVGSNLTISSGVLSANTLAGTDGVNDGTAGYAPAPLAADAGKYLKSDGTWAALPAANNISSNDWTALWQ